MATPAQNIIVRMWFRISQERQRESVYVEEWHGKYSPVDYAVAQELALPVERVGEALVAAGKRPPCWWVE
jgi:hypothetical protein